MMPPIRLIGGVQQDTSSSLHNRGGTHGERDNFGGLVKLHGSPRRLANRPITRLKKIMIGIFREDCETCTQSDGDDASDAHADAGKSQCSAAATRRARC